MGVKLRCIGGPRVCEFRRLEGDTKIQIQTNIHAARLAINNLPSVVRGSVAEVVNPLLDSIEELVADIEKLKNPATPGKGGSHEG